MADETPNALDRMLIENGLDPATVRAEWAAELANPREPQDPRREAWLGCLRRAESEDTPDGTDKYWNNVLARASRYFLEPTKGESSGQKTETGQAET